MRNKDLTDKRAQKSKEQALTTLMALCAKAERSSGDALRLMSRWGVEPKQREEVVEKLIEERFIDDSRYCAAFVREKVNLNGWGKYKIRTELMRKGIDKEIIEEHLSTLNKEDMVVRLTALITKRMRTVKYNSRQHLRDKLIRYGASQGYDFESVNCVVTEIISKHTKEEDENWAQDF